MSTSSQLPSTGDMLVLDTSKPTPLELYSKPVNSEVMVSDPSNAYYSAPVGSETEKAYLQTQQPNSNSQDLVQLVWEVGLIISAFHDDVKKVDEAGMSLQRRISQMETGLSSPFLAPNIEIMEQQGML